jgi:hypothetical protein
MDFIKIDDLPEEEKEAVIISEFERLFIIIAEEKEQEK